MMQPIGDTALQGIMRELKGLLRWRDSGSLNISMHSISGDMERAKVLVFRYLGRIFTSSFAVFMLEHIQFSFENIFNQGQKI